jgi:hypothetical protein
MQKKFMGLVTDNKGCGEVNHLNELVKTYTIVNCLPHFGPIEGSMTAISNVSVFILHRPSIDVKHLDVLFNNIIKNNMGRKEDGKPWRGGKDKSLVMM